jgi:hypothetical protein
MGLGRYRGEKRTKSDSNMNGPLLLISCRRKINHLEIFLLNAISNSRSAKCGFQMELAILIVCLLINVANFSMLMYLSRRGPRLLI